MKTEKLPGTAAPAVSVIIPVYNGARFIGETLASVFAQTFKDFEVIVIDDGSSDHTADVLEPWRGRIRYFYQENSGIAGARNSGVRKSRGRYLAFLDHDDLWLPEKLAMQVRAFEAHPDAGLVFTGGQSFDETGVVDPSIGAAYLTEWTRRSRTADPDVFKGALFEELIFRNPILSCSAIMVRKSDLTAMGGFDESIRIADDYDLYLRLACRQDMVFLRVPLFRYRVSSTSASGDLGARGNTWRTAAIQVLEKQIHDHPPAVVGLIRQSLARKYFETGYYYFSRQAFQAARPFFRKAVENSHRTAASLMYWAVTFFPERVVRKIRRAKQRAAGTGGSR